jgi:hypothetical protein
MTTVTNIILNGNKTENIPYKIKNEARTSILVFEILPEQYVNRKK